MKTLLATTLLTSVIAMLPFAGNAQQKRNLKQEAKNKALVEKFFYTFYNDKDIEKSRSMMDPDMINHHPFSGKGAEATLIAVKEHLFEKYPKFHVSIKRIVAEGDLVWIQCYTQNNPQDRGNMSMDIWRVKNGKITEHWDIIQAIPDGIDPASMYN